MKLYVLTMFFFLSSLWWPGLNANAEQSFTKYGNRVVSAALKQLNAQPNDAKLACLTNAGYVAIDGQDTHPFLDILTQKSGVSIGKGNLLQVHTASDEPLWFAFIKKKSSQELLLTYLEAADLEDIQATEALNVYVDVDQSFDAFSAVLGDKAFTLVTFANGWADGIPRDLMQGALWHDHLCCGVFSGYFTVKFIRQNFGLMENEKYYYIGAPAWCQDDYIMRVLNLTPGKSGYYTMAYPWSRPWSTSDQTYAKLGGIIIRFNSSSQSGQADLLSFDWCEEDFKSFINMPQLELDWKNDKWLHVCYNRFFMQHLENPEKFVSSLKSKELQSQQDLNRLIDMGANPLEEILGPDPTWVPDRE